MSRDPPHPRLNDRRGEAAQIEGRRHLPAAPYRRRLLAAQGGFGVNWG
jgi:hypothetical protein